LLFCSARNYAKGGLHRGIGARRIIAAIAGFKANIGATLPHALAGVKHDEPLRADALMHVAVDPVEDFGVIAVDLHGARRRMMRSGQSDEPYLYVPVVKCVIERE